MRQFLTGLSKIIIGGIIVAVLVGDGRFSKEGNSHKMLYFSDCHDIISLQYPAEFTQIERVDEEGVYGYTFSKSGIEGSQEGLEVQVRNMLGNSLQENSYTDLVDSFIDNLTDDRWVIRNMQETARSDRSLIIGAESPDGEVYALFMLEADEDIVLLVMLFVILTDWPDYESRAYSSLQSITWSSSAAHSLLGTSR